MTTYTSIYNKDPDVIPRFVSTNIYLEEESHTYYLKDDKDYRFKFSGTTLLGRYFEKFDGPKIAKKLVKYNPKYQGRTVEDLIEEWNQAGVTGTAVHLELENYLLHGTPVVSNKAKAGQAWLDRIIDKDRFDFYPEVILYCKEIGIAGTIDLLLHDRVTGKLHIMDWKTNKKITMSSFKGKKGWHEVTSHLDDCSFTKYALQMSLYHYLIKKNFPEFEIGERVILHLTDEKTFEYPCKYLEDDIVNIIDAFLGEVEDG